MFNAFILIAISASRAAELREDRAALLASLKYTQQSLNATGVFEYILSIKRERFGAHVSFRNPNHKRELSVELRRSPGGNRWNLIGSRWTPTMRSHLRVDGLASVFLRTVEKNPGSFEHRLDGARVNCMRDYKYPVPFEIGCRWGGDEAYIFTIFRVTSSGSLRSSGQLTS
jgi:hypothetical protein